MPRHDGLHEITAFATSMHSIRLTGEIAWWNPVDITSGGWAQYFSGFLSPIAPTYGSVLFIGMVVFEKIMTLFSVVIPEYYLYIVLNHFITPFLTCLFLLIYFVDITRYYYESALGDYSFMNSVSPKGGEGNEMLRSPFEIVENNTFEAGIAENSPPVYNHIWPRNQYLPAKTYSQLLEYQEKEEFVDMVDYSFNDKQDLHIYKKLDEFEGQAVSAMEDRVEGEYVIEDYGYNDWTIQCNAQTDGAVVFNLMYDKLWDICVDGEKVGTQKVNINYLGIYIGEGAHQITISYRPLARTIYPIAAFLLICTLVLLYIMIIMEDKNESSNSRRRLWNKNK